MVSVRLALGAKRHQCGKSLQRQEDRVEKELWRNAGKNVPTLCPEGLAALVPSALGQRHAYFLKSSTEPCFPCWGRGLCRGGGWGQLPLAAFPPLLFLSRLPVTSPFGLHLRETCHRQARRGQLGRAPQPDVGWTSGHLLNLSVVSTRLAGQWVSALRLVHEDMGLACTGFGVKILLLSRSSKEKRRSLLLGNSIPLR